MAPEIDGYGPRPNQSTTDRLLEDCRTMSASSVELIAKSWTEQAGPGWSQRMADHHEEASDAHAAWDEAERAALHVPEKNNHAGHWDELRNQILDLTENHDAMSSWREEHGEVVHRAEDALLGAALALSAGTELDESHRVTLLRPMSAVLPWLVEILSPAS